MSLRKTWYAALVLIVVASAWFGGCSSSSSNGGSGTSSGGNGPGVCQATCNKACGQDSDCDTSSGELCCDYGANGKVCQNAKTCPKFCTNDSNCQTASGQACERVSLSSGVQVCEPATGGLKTCNVDTDCPGNSDVCCKIYKEGLCVAANRCPKSCTTSSTCNTTSGEICCTSIGALDPSVTAPGLCLNPQYAPCPKTCASSSDCSATSQLCCNGICQDTCPQSCSQSSDCTNQICCKTSTASLPPAPHVFPTGPTCTGTPSYSSCQACGQSLGYCTRCAGCGTDAGTGSCSGTPYYADCTTCATNRGSCTYCPGCQQGTAFTCTGTAYLCSDFNGNPSGCLAQAGCDYPDGGTLCNGTPTACSTITVQSTCSAQSGCFASQTSTCTGTLTPCAQLTATTCSTQDGCSYTSGITSCDGTPTPCSGLTPTTCSTQPGCIVTQ